LVPIGRGPPSELTRFPICPPDPQRVEPLRDKAKLMNIVGPLIPVGIGLLVLGWVIFRSIVRRSQQARKASPQQQVADVKLEVDKLETRGDRRLRDAPPEFQRWQVEIFEIARDIYGQVDTKIALLAATIRLAEQRLAELKQAIETAERMGVPDIAVADERSLENDQPPESESRPSSESTGG
jgi:flagellar biosynthesis/type III secretory pathway M-ring protein FliF/YscJ